ncbi:4-hydroxythreonine-4-phosphate dehydrogenase [Nymphon striatum]|nr:4-hydroxythreonine-4-phosphate dehydrogenase [Nymphon striatum]
MTVCGFRHPMPPVSHQPKKKLLKGMEEFAGRANLTRQEFIQALGANGVEEQTFRDFVYAGLSWRQLVQARFAGRANASEGEIDRALSSGGGGSNVRVLISEIIMAAPPRQAEAVRARADNISQLRSESAFSAQARKYSATATRGNGGRLPWQNLSDLPPQLQPLILALAPGEVTAPLPIPNAIALFQLRAIEETSYSAPEYAAIEYAAYYMAGGRSADTLAKARVLKSKAHTCDDLYGAAKGQPAKVLERGSKAPADIPTDIAFELSKLDQGEVSTALTRSNGETLVFLMLCGRTPKVAEDADREQVAIGLRNRRLAGFADGHRSGPVDPANAQGVIDVVKRAVALVQSNEASAICTSPLHKQALQDGAGFEFPGHTEFLASLAGVDDVVMMLASSRLRVVPVTIHVALADVPKTLTKDLLETRLRITKDCAGSAIRNCRPMHCGRGS